MMIHNILSHIFMNDDILWWQIINAKRVGLIELFYHCSLLPFSHGTLFGKVEKHYKIKEITGVYECKILKTMNMHTLYIHNISIVQKLCMYSSCIYFINEQKIPLTQYIKCVNIHLLSGAYIGCLPFQVLPQSSTFHGNRTSKDASIYVLWLESFLNPKLNPQSKCVK